MTIDSLLEATCPHGVQYQHCPDPDCNDELDGTDDQDDDEWQPGECDNCFGGDENGVTATGPLGDVFCACAIGQGAAEGECRCGPEGGAE